MKKLIGILTLVLVFSLTANAQRRNDGPRKGMKADYTPEQVAELQTKRMTLHLDLTKAQQDLVFGLFKENAIERESLKEAREKRRDSNLRPTEEERFKLENDRLDRQIAHKAELKKILNQEQYKKWEQFKDMRNGRKDGRKNGNKSRKNSKFNF